MRAGVSLREIFSCHKTRQKLQAYTISSSQQTVFFSSSSSSTISSFLFFIFFTFFLRAFGSACDYLSIAAKSSESAMGVAAMHSSTSTEDFDRYSVEKESRRK
jgi:ABC-type transport system involved in multi-copper enzyme maturation permease subunit